ncbi:MAG: OPT/YSL family transporter [Verrucomicrobia bacterium]|nr:OPT/YSL family transporter [Verrucomicrobiota bacterium]
MPQLTLRSGLTGMLIGGVLSLTNLYVGAKTGWTLGVGITSVILAFAAFKVLSAIGLGKDFTLLENNAMQSIATAAGYMTAPLISSLAAYMMVTNQVIPMMHTLIWITAIAILGVLFAFPLKRRFINDEQHPFPEGRAAGIVMDALHTGDAASGLLKAKLLAITGGASALLKLMQSEAIMNKLRLSMLTVPEFLDGWAYRLGTLRVFGTDLRQLTVRPDTDFVMMAAGGLMGIRTGVSLMVGSVINYLILVPLMIQAGDIHGRVVNGVAQFGFREITKWALWGGVAMMTTASLFAFFAKPKILLSAFRGLGRKRAPGADQDPMTAIELPMWVFVVFIPLVGGLTVWLANLFFGVSFWMGALAIPLIFVFTDQYPMPAATIWRAVAELLMQGLGNLPMSARWAVLIGALLGLAFEGVRLATKGRFWLSGVGIGLATVIPFNTCFAMFLGALFFWAAERFWSNKESAGNRIIVQNQEPICAGVIAGGALMGIAVILIENFALGGR